MEGSRQAGGELAAGRGTNGIAGTVTMRGERFPAQPGEGLREATFRKLQSNVATYRALLSSIIHTYTRSGREDNAFPCVGPGLLMYSAEGEIETVVRGRGLSPVRPGRSVED